MLLSTLLCFTFAKPFAPQIVWEKGGIGQFQLSVDKKSGLALTGWNGNHADFIRIDIDSGAVIPQPSRQQFDNLRVNNRFIDFHGQMLELLFSSANTAIATKWDGLYRIGSDERCVNWTSAIGGYNNVLHGDPDRGPFVLEYLEGEPHYDWIQKCNVVMPDFQVLKTTYYKCLDAGPDGVLVEKILGKMRPRDEQNGGDQSATYLDPKAGKEHWRVKEVTKALFWNGYVVMQHKKLELRAIKTGRLQPLPPSLQGDWGIEGVVGDYLLLIKGKYGSPETIRCVKATQPIAPLLSFRRHPVDPPKKTTRAPSVTPSAAAQEMWSESGVPALCAPGPNSNSVFLLFGKQWELRDLETGQFMPYRSADAPRFNGAIEKKINVNGEAGEVIWQSARTSIVQLSGRRFAVQMGGSVKVFPVPSVITHDSDMGLGEAPLGVAGNPDLGSFGLFGTLYSGAGWLAYECPVYYLNCDGTPLSPAKVDDTEGEARTLGNDFAYRDEASYLSGYYYFRWIGGFLYTTEIDSRPNGTAVLKNPITGEVVLKLPDIDARSGFVFSIGPYLLLQWDKKTVCWRINWPKGR